MAAGLFATGVAQSDQQQLFRRNIKKNSFPSPDLLFDQFPAFQCHRRRPPATSTFNATLDVTERQTGVQSVQPLERIASEYPGQHRWRSSGRSLTATTWSYTAANPWPGDLDYAGMDILPVWTMTAKSFQR